MLNNVEIFGAIGGLMIPKDKSSDRIGEYVELFVDQIPTLTEQIRRSLREQKFAAVITSMKSVAFMLGEIHANWLKTEADRILRHATTRNLAQCTMDMEPFISELLSLSIELQIVQKKAGPIGPQSKIGSYTDVVNNVKAIGELIENQDFEMALIMLDFIEQLNGDENAARMRKALGQKNQRAAKSAADAICRDCNRHLRELGVKLSDLRKVVLAVDDHPDILVTLKGMLKGHYNVYAAAGGKTALAIMETHKPDMFLLDIEMPDIGGFELAKTIRAMDKFAYTPIIFITGIATREYVMEALSCGANDFIVKPASYNSLLAKVSKHI